MRQLNMVMQTIGLRKLSLVKCGIYSQALPLLASEIFKISISV